MIYDIKGRMYPEFLKVAPKNKHMYEGSAGRDKNTKMEGGTGDDSG